jgi:hypothetical protein
VRAGLLAKEVEDAIRYGRELAPPGYADALFLELLRPSFAALDPDFMRLVLSTRKRLGQERRAHRAYESSVTFLSPIRRS